MNSQDLIDNLDETINSLTSSLRSYQLADGGVVGYHLTDKVSGIWSTSEVVHILLKINPDLVKEPWIVRAAEYLSKLQNENGGWGFRGKGKSIVDITAWACLALYHFGDRFKDQVARGVQFLLEARKNSKQAEDKGGWGLTTFEPDRIYSTWIASNSFTRLLNERRGWFEKIVQNEMHQAIGDSMAWLKSSKGENGAWAPLGDENDTVTSTSLALINLFSGGEDPANYVESFVYLKKNSVNNLWPLETELVITQEGYELAQEWFTSAYCFRVLIFYAELGICSFDILHKTYTSLSTLIENDRVRPAIEGSASYIWPIPLMIEALDKFKILVSRKKKEYTDFLYLKEMEEQKKKKLEMEAYLKNQFPFPISQVYFSFNHELDHHRRFQYLVQMYEVLIKYVAIVSLSAVISSNEKIPQIKNAIEEKFKRPTLGDWAGITETIFTYSSKVSNFLYPWKKEEVSKKQPNFVDPTLPKTNLNQCYTEIVSLRNSWSGHGAVRSVYEYKMETEKQIPALFSLLNRFMFLAKCNSFLILSSDYNEFGDGDLYKIRVFNGLDILDDSLEIQRRLSEGHREQLIRYVYFHNIESSAIVNLYPFLSYMICPDCKRERFFFFNSVKNSGKTMYLSFECGHTLEYDNQSHFTKRFSAVDIKF